MDVVQIFHLVLVGLGIVVALAALYWKSRERSSLIEWPEQMLSERGMIGFSGQVREPARAEGDVLLKQIEERLAEIDKTVEEFHTTANAAITELDDKYQQMLFLYSLIDEKKKEIAVVYNTEPEAPPVKAPSAKSRQTSDKNRSSHPRRKEILNLSKQGLSVTEIAQELQVGQDMVSLILELGKAR